MIRQLTAADRDAATDLWVRAGLTRPWNPPDEDFDRAVSGPTSAVLGAIDEQDVIATVMVGHDGHRGWVYYLAVDPSTRRRGLGRRMMQEAEGWLRARGAVKLNVMVRHGNAAALGFYDRLGYEDAEVTVLARWLTDADEQLR
jgi:ribosomal protein S18 acetylase RimI-like enzyme